VVTAHAAVDDVASVGDAVEGIQPIAGGIGRFDEGHGRLLLRR
jgi:hypothetical protein